MTHLSSGIVSAFNEPATRELYTNSYSDSRKNSSSNNSHDPIMFSGNREESVGCDRRVHDDDEDEDMTIESGGGLYMEGSMDFVIGTDDEDDNTMISLNQHHNHNLNNNNNINNGTGDNINIDMSLDDNNMDGDVGFISTIALQSIASNCVLPSYHSHNDEVKEEQIRQQQSQQQQQSQLQNYSLSMANGSTNSDPFIYSYASWQNLPAPGSTNEDVSPAVSTTAETLLVNNVQQQQQQQQFFNGFSDGNAIDPTVLYTQSQQQQQSSQSQQSQSQPQQPQQQQYMDDTMIRSNLFVSGLHPSVTDIKLHELFHPYGSIESAKVMLDIHTGKSRGIAFVKFDNVNSAERAVSTLNNSVHLGETIAVRVAKPHAAYRPGAPTNKTFVRNVPLTVKKSDLAAHFSRYGDVIDVSIHSDTAQRVTNKKRNVVFVTYTTKEAAARAAQETHTTMPFPDCEGIPLLAKVAEDSAHRIERLARRGTGRGSKCGGISHGGDSCSSLPSHHQHINNNNNHINNNNNNHHHHGGGGMHKGMDHFTSASMSSYPFPPNTAPPPPHPSTTTNATNATATTLCMPPIITTDPYGNYTAPPPAAFYATPFIPMPHHTFNGANSSTTSIQHNHIINNNNNNNNTTNSPINMGGLGNSIKNGNNSINNTNNTAGGFAPILFFGPESAPPPMYTSYDGTLHSPVPAVRSSSNSSNHANNNNTNTNNNSNNNNNNNNNNNGNKNNGNNNKSTDHIQPLMMCPTRHAAMMGPAPTVMYYMSNGQMALGPPPHA